MSGVNGVGERARVGRRSSWWVRVGLLPVGVWLTVAPFVLDYRGADASVAAAVNDTLVGVLVFTLALASLLIPEP
jgi:hypothetical protein